MNVAGDVPCQKIAVTGGKGDDVIVFEHVDLPCKKRVATSVACASMNNIQVQMFRTVFLCKHNWVMVSHDIKNNFSGKQVIRESHDDFY